MNLFLGFLEPFTELVFGGHTAYTLDLAIDLISRPSVTPKDAGCQVTPVDERALHVALFAFSLFFTLAHLLVATEPAAAQLVGRAGAIYETG